MRVKEQVACKRCGRMFLPGRAVRPASYCSYQCRHHLGLLVPTPCQHCGTMMAGRKRKFCSLGCRLKSQHLHAVYKQKVCALCGISFHTRCAKTLHCSDCRARAIRLAEARALANVTRHCKHCAGAFHPAQGRQVFCSKRCKNCYECVQKRYWRKGKFVEEVSIGVLYERDQGRCGICDKPVTREYQHPHSLSASIDHVRALSKGGEHSYDNTQLAHLGCNSRKHIKPAALLW